MEDKLITLRKKAMRLPMTPGVYLMKDRKGAIIYVGKAKALKARVSQYFSARPQYIKVSKMVENTEDFDFILTDSEFEALVLECSLIKQHKPKYNILLKDDKGYQYIRIAYGDWPTIVVARKKFDDGAEYIGPYTSSHAVSRAVDEALKIFRLPQCTKVFPRDRGKGRPCLNFFINQCAAPCAGKMSHTQYREAVNAAIAFLKGGSAETLRDLTAQMDAASQALDFEKAARLRDTIRAIRRMTDKQKVVSTGVKRQDVFAVVRGGVDAGDEGEKACMAVLRFQQGSLRDSEHFIFENPEDMPAARHELLRSFYMMRDDIPPQVTIDGEVEDAPLIERWLSEKAERTVRLKIPIKGGQAELVAMCRSNAAEKLAQATGKTGKVTAALDELARLLSLPSPPEIIEAYDISHTAGSDNVAGMVVFKGGKPYKAGYRRFGIKGFTGQDDYASMAEVLERRLHRYEEEKDSGEGFGRLPDLILLDGGLGQVHAVLPVLKQCGVTIPVFGMVKDSRHRTRAIAADGGELALNSKRAAFTLVSEIQQEVHRFAVTYHRGKRKTKSLTGTLTAIEGIGPARAKALLHHFKTVAAIRTASVDELCAVEGMTKTAAEHVYAAMHAEQPVESLI